MRIDRIEAIIPHPDNQTSHTTVVMMSGERIVVEAYVTTVRALVCKAIGQP